MSSYDGWLPPLISHEPHQAHTTIHISQSQPQDSHRCDETSTRTPELVLDLEASVYFVSNNEELNDFEGLFVFEICETLCTPEHGIQDTVAFFPYLASEKGRITWTEMLHGGEESCSELSWEEMILSFSRFLSGMRKQGLGRYVVDIRIEKEIVIPEEELKSWLSWYDAKKKSDPGFIFEFKEALYRPRTMEELLNEAAKPRLSSLSAVDLDGFEASEAAKISAECCIFCMDEFLNESKLASELPACSHVFHRDCLEKWLKDSNECPICRSQVLPTDDHAPRKQQE